MPSRRYQFGRADEATHPDSIRATLAEFLSTFVFVFAGEGSILSLGTLCLLSYELYMYIVVIFYFHPLIYNSCRQDIKGLQFGLNLRDNHRRVGGHSTCACAVSVLRCGVQYEHIRWPCQPCGYLWCPYRRKNLCPSCLLLLSCSALGFHFGCSLAKGLHCRNGNNQSIGRHRAIP
ncbi:hypothetical protein SLE2022_294380 [Rubroshorea leprosula]